MNTRIITIPVEGLTMDEQQVLCAACAAVCARIVGVQAHEWILNRATDTVSGVMKWSDYEAIAMGTEALRMEVVRLHDAHHTLQCRDLTCPASRRPAPRDRNTARNTGFVQHPPDYDPRG